MFRFFLMCGSPWQAKAAYGHGRTTGRLRRELGVSCDLPGRMCLGLGGSLKICYQGK